MIKRAFAPVVDAGTRLLILGSLPGDASLAATQYYAHPRNDFWRLLGGALGSDLEGLAYEARLVMIRRAGVGLWDVIASAVRPGSLDGAVRHAVGADLIGLIATLPDLKAIAFNGALAARIGRRTLAVPGPRLSLIDLPSSSPAHARPLAEKAQAWSEIGRMLR